MNHITPPLIHLNGSNREYLFNRYKDSFEKLLAFQEAFMQIDVHPRDYYPMGDDYWMRAKTDHDEMRKKMFDLFNWIEQHMSALQP